MAARLVTTLLFLCTGLTGIVCTPQGAHIKRLRFGKEEQDPGRRLLQPHIRGSHARYKGTVSPERRLFDKLGYRYDGLSRPVLDANTTVVVNFSISLHHIMDLVEKNQTLVTHVWIYEEWIDEIMRWDPEDYGGLTHTVLPSNRLWLPDIYIFNNAETGIEGFVTVNESRALVHYDGRIEWVVPLMIKSSCEVNVVYFPFDNQWCSIRFGSWIHDTKHLDLMQKQENVDLRPFVTNSEFDLIKTRLERRVTSMDLFSGHFAQITLSLHIKRKPLYYAYTVLAPTLVLCILTLFSFMLPCDNGAKVGIGLTVFLSLYVLQLAIAENMPESNNLPLIGLFLTLVMTLNCVSLLFATLVINVKKKGDRKPCPPVPKLLLVLCQKILASATCSKVLSFYDFYDLCDEIPSCDYISSVRGPSAEQDSAAGSSSTINDDSRANQNEGGDTTSCSSDGCRMADSVEFLVEDNVIKKRITGNIKRPSLDLISRCSVVSVRPEHSKLYAFLRENDQPKDPRLEWFLVAEILDKILFVIFFIAMFTTIFMLLVIIPWVNDVK